MKKILVIEDDRTVCEVLELKLGAQDYDVSMAHNGKDGWEKVGSEKPDLIILDVGIPILDGFELCDMIKKSEKYKKIPVIMLTARRTIGDWDEGLNAGANIYMNKPYDWFELLENISTLTE